MDKQKLYYLKQKLLGVVMLILSALIVFTTSDLTVAFITVPIGLYLLISKNTILVDDDYFVESINKELDKRS